MKKTIVLISIFITVFACSNNDSVNVNDPGPKMVPDHTPYIAGLIEASPDTTFHYPEVIVGYFSDHQSAHAPGILPRHQYKGVYNLTLKRQVVQTSILFALSWQPELHAVVTVLGPLDTSKEKEVKFTSEGNGVYGDEGYHLPRVANGQYRMQVKMPDGRSYSSTTNIPQKVNVKLKNPITTKVSLQHYDNGAPRESASHRYHILYNPPRNGFITVKQYNTDRDHQLFFLKPGEHFRNADYGNYLRAGADYEIELTSTQPSDSVSLPWGQDLTKPRSKIRSSQHDWLRFSFFSPGISKMFFSLYNYYAIGPKWDEQYHDAPQDSALAQDTHYLHNVSTIRKVSNEGTVLPKDATDAIGFFAGEYSRYLQTTQYANREFDLDSVLTAYEQE